MGDPRSLERLRIAVTCGEPGGIGAEAALKALASLLADNDLAQPQYLLVGPREVWQENARLTGFDLDTPGLELIDIPVDCPSALWRWGEVTDYSARAALAAVLEGARLALGGGADALVTAPLTKEGLRRAGCDAPGHTELLGSLCAGSPRPTMMFASPGLKVFLVTTHLPLCEVSGRITRDEVLATVRAAHEGLTGDFGISRPRIGVCGLNPHAGEGGQLGLEELEQIIPAVKAALSEGIDAMGPVAADALFARAAKEPEGVDAIVAMFHDQGLTAFKLNHFDDGVNVTVGLPLVRTSPDHGTALDIAGKGEANPSSTLEALKLAAHIAAVRKAGE